MYDVTALGELLIDFAPVGIDKDGYPAVAAHPGGAPGNYLSALAAFGAKTAFLGKVGDDTFGKLLIGTLQKAGIETKGIVKDPGFFTTLAFVTLDKNGNRSFSFARKPGADTRLRFEELDLSLIDQAGAFHFGTLGLTGEPVRRATRMAAAYAKEKGKLITFDPNLRLSLWEGPEEARREILWGLHQADIVKMSGEELDFLWGCGEEEGAERLLSEFGVQLAMITMGSEGCYLQNANAAVSVSCPPVEVRDTTGAGDIFGGSAVSRIIRLGKEPRSLSRRDLTEIGRFATAAASLSTQKSGGIPSIPTEPEVLAAVGSAFVRE